MYHYCESISSPDATLYRPQIHRAKMVELRCDLMSLSASEVEELVGNAERTIATCRTSDPAHAEEIYSAAIRGGAWAIDIDISMGAELIGRLGPLAHEAESLLIISHHYPATPSLEELRGEVERIYSLGADIAKVVTTASSVEESLVVHNLYRHFAAERLVAFAMGNEGAFTRRLSLLAGAPYTYTVPADGTPTALGQSTTPQMKASLEGCRSLERIAIPSVVTPPCSKSAAQRAILSALLAEGTTIINGYTRSNDSEAALEVARTLGAEVALSGRKLTIRSKGYRAISQQLNSTTTTLCVGESALLTRLLIPIVATLLEEGEVVIEGCGSLLGRSVAETIGLIVANGAECESNGGHLPLRITRGARFGTHIVTDGSHSSQHISGLMMALALIDRDEMSHIEVRNAVSTPYITLTASIMEQFEGIVTLGGGNGTLTIDIEPEPPVASRLTLEPDFSSAAYFAAAYAIAQSGYAVAESYTLRCNIGTHQPDEVALMLLDIAGAHIRIRKGAIDLLPSSALRPIAYDATNTPDLIPTLAVVALFAEGESVIGGLDRLAGKESNRVVSLVENLVAIGADLRIEGSRLHIRGGAPLHSAPIHTYGDHRIAMAFAVASLFITPRLSLDNCECVAKSFPKFFDALK
ncbi:MAG: type I 3-dehydroquinate dehydratase [Tidjanibacter sp.]|nr:type I 3-dehydroquinate dehydratase [Tidjanibacter sp.]